MDIKALVETAQNLFSNRTSFELLLQEIAENFYPQRADFTLRRTLGDEYASNLMTSYPILVRRDFGDQIGTMLRPHEKQWFKLARADSDKEDNEAKRWIERVITIQRKAMYDRKTQFARATKESDHDFAAFGQCVMSVRLNKAADALLYRTWHLRDVVWTENEEGDISFIARKWKPYQRDLKRLFPNVHENITNNEKKKPFEKIECFHIIVEADMYDDHANGKPYWSLYYDIQNHHLMEAVAVWNKEYIIPRWQTVSGSQYAFSPATITALPDARLIQAMTYTLLEAGEKATNPPLIATQDVVRSDISVYPGGVTWVAQDYDEKLGEALRPIKQDLRGLPFGADMHADSRSMIASAFFLNKLTLPERAPEMTAYEVGQRIQEYIRGALPIFEPMEQEYNGAMCELTFDLLMRAGAFGSMHDMPLSLRGADMQFRFESPLHDVIEEQKGQKFLEAKALLAEAVAADPGALVLVDVKSALRDALSGIGVPAEWIRNEVDVEKAEKAQQIEEQNQNMLDKMEQGSVVAANLSKAQAEMAQ